jgi:hypothetical protein
MVYSDEARKCNLGSLVPKGAPDVHKQLGIENFSPREVISLGQTVAE